MNMVVQSLGWLMATLLDVILDLGFSILHKCRVRLYGIDTPESQQETKTKRLEEK